MRQREAAMMPQGLKGMLGGPSRRDRDTDAPPDPHAVRGQAPTHRPASSASSSSDSASTSASTSSSASTPASTPAPASASASSLAPSPSLRSPKAPSPRSSAFAFARTSSLSSPLSFWKRATPASTSTSTSSPSEAGAGSEKVPPHEAASRGGGKTGSEAARMGKEGGEPQGSAHTRALSQSSRVKSLPTEGIRRGGFTGRKGSRSLGAGKRGSSNGGGEAKAGSHGTRKAFSGPLRRGASLEATATGLGASPGASGSGHRSNIVRNVKPGRRSEEPTQGGKEALRKSRSARVGGPTRPAAAPVVARGAADTVARSRSHRGMLETQAAVADTADAADAGDAGDAGAGAGSRGTSPNGGRPTFQKGEPFRRLSSDKWASMESLTEEEEESADADLLSFESISIGSGEAQDVARGAPDGHYQQGYADCLPGLGSARGDPLHLRQLDGGRELASTASMAGAAPVVLPQAEEGAHAHASSDPAGSPGGAHCQGPVLIRISSPAVGRSPLGSPGPGGSPGRVPSSRGVARCASMATAGGGVGSPRPARFQRQRSEMPDRRNPARLGSPSAAFPSADELSVSARECVATLRCAEGRPEDRCAAAKELRHMAKEGPSQIRALLASGAVEALVEQLQCSHAETVEHCATALLNVSLHEKFKGELLKCADLLDNTVFVLYSGSLRAKSSAAATLCCVSTLEGTREAIMGAGALPGLVSLVRQGDAVGKRDAANCLLSLCISRTMRLPIAQSEAVAALCEVLQEGSVDLDQQAASIFSALARIPEGREALLSQGALTPLAELLESGETAACREHAVTALLGLAMNNRGCLWQIDELGITMALDVLSRSENIPLQAKAAGLKEILSKFACEI